MLTDKDLTWLTLQNIGEISHVRQFENALTNDVFLITLHQNRRYIFKRLNRQARSDEDRQSEFLVQQLAYQHGLTSVVLAHSNDYKLQQYIEGELLTTKTHNLSQLLAIQLHRIHQLPALHAPKQRLFFELQRLKSQLPVAIDESRFKQFSQLAKALDSRNCADILCHGDLSLNNVLQGHNEQLYIIDWEYAVIACSAYDLAFCNCINNFTDAESKTLINNYYQQSSFKKDKTLESLQKDCVSYSKIFNYINELWSICFVGKD
ncbi:MAG: phosphotransferase [Psychromonas sp.]